VGITVGDIAGNGIDAAVLTSLVKHTVRAHASDAGTSPATVLGLTNNIVRRSTPPEMFATVFFGVLDRSGMKLTYANAGHTTAAVVRPGGRIDELSVTGPILGAFENVEYEQSETDLGHKDLLFAYTDGLTEARCHGVHYGEPRLFELLAQVEGGSADRFVTAAIEDVLSYTDNHLRDDLAILALRPVGSRANPQPKARRHLGEAPEG